jgi:hypothetical protein
LKKNSQYEYGLVSHAFCATIKKIIQEFDILIAKIENLFSKNIDNNNNKIKKNENLTLQKMYYLLQPSKLILKIIQKMCNNVKDKTGGELIDFLYTEMLNQGFFIL